MQCFVCKALLDVMQTPQSGFECLLYEPYRVPEFDDLSNAESFVLGFSIHVEPRPDANGVRILDSALKIRWRPIETSPDHWVRNAFLTFYFSPQSRSHKEDNSWRLDVKRASPTQDAETMDQDPSRSIPGNSECSKCQELAEMLASGDVAYEDVLGDPNDSDGEDYQEVPVYQDRAGALRSAIPSVEGECLAPSLLAKLGEVFSTRCPKGGLGVGGDCDVKLLPEGVNSSTSSDNGWAQVESWIEICQRTHAKCRQRVGEDSGLPNKYPTRLLDVGLGSVPEGPVRLIVTEDATPRGDYITLSHCWGTNPVVSLTSDNYDSFMDCIDFCLLPQTFKDVVTITRKLGFQYLWIDSLCINQQGAGAAEDWLRESALMGSVYRNAFLNIGAAGASDARGGCFQEREYGGVLQPVIHKPECPLHFHDFSQPYTLLEENFVEKSLLGEPLLKRGWVFQERFLARRMVYFGSQQLFWHCNESLVCETCPEYMTTPTPLSNLFQIEEVAGSSSDKALVGFMGLHHWHSIVEEYSCKALTRSEDKLVAISGVAQLYHDRALANHDQYCAGVWRSDFPIGLCWKVKRGEGTSPVKYRAPSWSWASLDGIIEAPTQCPTMENSGRLLAVFDDPEIELVSQLNKYGAVKAASMRIRTRLVSAEAVRKESTSGDVFYVLSVNGVQLPDSEWYPDVSPNEAKTVIECACFATGKFGLYGITVASVDQWDEGKGRGQKDKACDTRRDSAGGMVEVTETEVTTHEGSSRASSNSVRSWVQPMLRKRSSKEPSAKPRDYVRTGAFLITAEDAPNDWCGPVSPFTELWEMDLDQEEWFRLL